MALVEEFVQLLAWSHRLSDPLAWVVITIFLGGAVLEWTDRDGARSITVVGWGLFSVFWFSLIHYYLIVSKSAVEGIGCIVAVPACVYTGYLLFRGRDSLFVLSRAVGAMGLIFLPFEALPVLTTALIETVTYQTEFLMGFLGQTAPEDFRVVSGTVVDRPDRRNTFLFVDDTGHQLTYTIRIACTGLGSVAIVGGLIGAVRAPLTRKLRALAVSIPVIYALNLVRNVFIGLTFGQQRLHVAPDLVLGVFSATDPYKVSYFLADRVIAQGLSVLVLVAITWLVVRELPATLVIIEDLLYLLTGTDYELQSIVADSEPTHTE